jgi:hypothetical protein
VLFWKTASVLVTPDKYCLTFLWIKALKHLLAITARLPKPDEMIPFLKPAILIKLSGI